MTPERFSEITGRFDELTIVLAGDFCLDRYLEIDADRAEISIETGLAVHNVTHVRPQPGAAGTILNNLVALGVGEIRPVGFGGEDGEGWELERALMSRAGVSMNGFFRTSARRTFTYTKPLMCREGRPPEELNRLDFKNWTPTPPEVERTLIDRLMAAVEGADGVFALDQVDLPETGVVTPAVRQVLGGLARRGKLVLGDSRQGLRDWPPVLFKMNARELGSLSGDLSSVDLDGVLMQAIRLAGRNQQTVFVTLAEQGIVGATPTGKAAHVPAYPVRGLIDIVGAGDAVAANLTAALAAGATLEESMELAMAAASVVIHQLGTTGTADCQQLKGLLC